jgi:hypothetical protein
MCVREKRSRLACLRTVAREIDVWVEFEFSLLYLVASIANFRVSHYEILKRSAIVVGNSFSVRLSRPQKSLARSAQRKSIVLVI